MKRIGPCVAALPGLVAVAWMSTLALAQSNLSVRELDSFAELAPWKAGASDGVKASVHPAQGVAGKALRLDFDLGGTAGYALAQRALAIDLPPNYEALYRRPPERNALRLPIEYLRFGWRRMSPEAAGVLRDLSARHEVYIITGRSVAGEPLIRRWLRSHALEGCVSGIEMAPPGLRPSQQRKEGRIHRRGAAGLSGAAFPLFRDASSTFLCNDDR